VAGSFFFQANQCFGLCAWRTERGQPWAAAGGQRPSPRPQRAAGGQLWHPGRRPRTSLVPPHGISYLHTRTRTHAHTRAQVCRHLAQQAASLEQLAHPALDALTRNADTINLERVTWRPDLIRLICLCRTCCTSLRRVVFTRGLAVHADLMRHVKPITYCRGAALLGVPSRPSSSPPPRCRRRPTVPRHCPSNPRAPPFRWAPQVRKIKTQHQRLSGRVTGLREVLERYMGERRALTDDTHVM
jgi:hypothetical protein